ncbi:acetate uptake transporter [Methanomassiliicoccus luminyensis]|jgi:succinate-acetate transporter protein|uniref:acetate uptake transporter n=1 Tax=Methanomassiliicoccus luminyensis TaxID=1080712 RepID=UPI00036A13ED|nr:GPR1/FUN34/YaaH family transporter [Methanomassiliicoccus luminyensis]
MNNDTTANPAPLGLMGFGMTTILLSLSNAGFFAMGGAILMMGLLYGGAAQITAGLMEWKKGNTFGLTAFTSYGVFWVVLVGINLLPRLGLSGPESAQVMGVFLLLWGVFTAYMFVGTLNTNRAMQLVFGSLAATFFVLAVADYFELAGLKTAAGFLGLVPGISAIYLAMGQVLNEALGRPVIPLFPVRKAAKASPAVKEATE